MESPAEIPTSNGWLEFGIWTALASIVVVAAVHYFFSSKSTSENVSSVVEDAPIAAPATTKASASKHKGSCKVRSVPHLLHGPITVTYFVLFTREFADSVNKLGPDQVELSRILILSQNKITRSRRLLHSVFRTYHNSRITYRYDTSPKPEYDVPRLISPQNIPRPHAAA